MDLVLRTSIVLLVAGAASLVMRDASAAARCRLWYLALVAVLVAPVAARVVPEIPVLPAFAMPAPASMHTDRGKPGASMRALARDEQERVAAPVASAPGDESPTAGGTTAVLVALRWAGTLFAALFFLGSHLLAHRLTRRAVAAPAAWQLEVWNTAARLGIRGDVRLGIVEGLRSPLVVGVLQPRVLLPAEAAGWDDDRRHAVLHHELAHVARGDCRAQVAVQAACALYWFNPLVWLAGRAFRRERERACDDMVLAGGAAASAYAGHLLAIAAEIGRGVGSPAVLAMARPSELEGRLVGILSATRARTPARTTAPLLALLVALTSAGSLALAPVRAAAPVLPDTTAPTPVMWQAAQSPGPAPALDWAVETLASSPDEHARENAAMALAVAGDDVAVGPLVAALDDPSSEVREKAAAGLALRSSDEVVAPLLRALGDADPQVREKAAVGLALRRDPRVVDALIDAASDPDAQVREKVAIALASSGDGRAHAVLVGMTSDPDESVRRKAAGALAILAAGETVIRDEAARVRGDLGRLAEILSWVLR